MVEIPVELVQVASAVLGTASLGLIAWTARELYRVHGQVMANMSRIARLENQVDGLNGQGGGREDQ